MLTDKKYQFSTPELWGGIECTINRIENNFQDQLTYSGHYQRSDDIEQFAKLGLRAIRYPILWERHQPDQNGVIDWSWAERQLSSIREHNIQPIVGLTHHGSGPAFTSLIALTYPEKLAMYASKVVDKFPWIDFYTPVNEPHTTARFSGLYGLWYPHHKDTHSYARMLINQLKGTVLSMQAIRKINPHAKLIQTEDLSKTHSTSILQYQAHFENERRWLTYDILCGLVSSNHFLWPFLISHGIREDELLFFVENPCIPDVVGLNYYVTSERYLDHAVDNYPSHLHGGNERHTYVDVEAVRATKPDGLEKLLAQTWNRFKLPIAITEVHLSCTREEQMRWFNEVWKICCDAREKNINVLAVTAWSLLGSYDWASLLTRSERKYETGVFDVRNNTLRKTAVANLIKELATEGVSKHPLLNQKGWWHFDTKTVNQKPIVLIIGKNGTLGNAFAKACTMRSIDYTILSKNELDICNVADVNEAIDFYRPWAVINTSGYAKVDDAETDKEKCFAINSDAPVYMAKLCGEKGIKFMTFSSDLVFDGIKKSPYFETDEVSPLNVYGESKVDCEKKILSVNGDSLIIRTSAFFSPYDNYNFAFNVLYALKHHKSYTVLNDVYVSPTYVPDLVDTALDLFIDNESGIWHLANDGNVTWAEFAQEIASRSGFEKVGIIAKPLSEMNFKAKRPLHSSLQSNNGIIMPSLENALGRFFQHKLTLQH